MTTPAPQPRTTSWYGARMLLIIAAVCFFLAAITASGSDVLNGPMWAWAFGGFAAWALSGAVP